MNLEVKSLKFIILSTVWKRRDSRVTWPNKAWARRQNNVYKSSQILAHMVETLLNVIDKYTEWFLSVPPFYLGFSERKTQLKLLSC